MLTWLGKRVAVVGNAPTALRNTRDIDGFDLVVRFNRFRLGEGLEAVGMRTDVFCTCISNTSVINDDLTHFTRDTRYALDVSWRYSRQRDSNLSALRQLLPDYTLIDGRARAREVWSELRSHKPPSSGLSAVAWFLGSGAAEVYLTGFSFERLKDDHYFSDPAHPFSYRHHSPLNELMWLADHAAHPALSFDNHIRWRLSRVGVDLPPSA